MSDWPLIAEPPLLLEGGRDAAQGGDRGSAAQGLQAAGPRRPEAPSPTCALQEVLSQHAGDQEGLIVALTKLRNDDEKLEPDSKGLSGLVQLLMKVSGVGATEGCRRCCPAAGQALLTSPRSTPPPPPPPPAGRQPAFREHKPRGAHPGGAAPPDRGAGHRPGVSVADDCGCGALKAGGCSEQRWKALPPHPCPLACA